MRKLIKLKNMNLKKLRKIFREARLRNDTKIFDSCMSSSYTYAHPKDARHVAYSIPYGSAIQLNIKWGKDDYKDAETISDLFSHLSDFESDIDMDSTIEGWDSDDYISHEMNALVIITDEDDEDYVVFCVE